MKNLLKTLADIIVEDLTTLYKAMHEFFTNDDISVGEKILLAFIAIVVIAFVAVCPIISAFIIYMLYRWAQKFSVDDPDEE